MTWATFAVFEVPFTDFELPVEVLAIGLITGLSYGLLAVGLTLVYRTTRVINFAHGALGAFPSLLLAVLVLDVGLGYWLALPVALAAGVGGGALLELAVIRRLRDASRLVVMVATIAAAQMLGVFGLLLPLDDSGLVSESYPTPFTTTVDLGNLQLHAGHLLIIVVAPALALGLSTYLKYTRMGLAARATAENSPAALMTGIPVKRVSLVVWSVAGLFAAASGILIAGTQPVSGAAGALGGGLLVRGLAAAMIGGLERLSMVFVAGVGIGLLEVLVQWNYPTGGLISLLLFGLILGSLVIHRGLAASVRGGAASSWALAAELKPLPRRLASHPRVRAARGVMIVGLTGGTAVMAQVLSPSQRVLLSSVLLWAMMGLSLVVLTGFAGQLSLGHYAFVALGAVVGGRMATLGFPSGTSVGYALIACGLLAFLVGVPALRVRGLFLAVTTLAFAVAAEGWLYLQDWLVKSGGSGFTEAATSLIIRRPTWFGISFSSEVRYAWLCIGLLVVTAFVVHRIRATGVGRTMIAVRDNEAAAASMSVSPRRVKITAFALSGMIAGAAGYFYGGLLVNFQSAVAGLQNSLDLVVMVILGGVTTVTGAVLGAMWARGIPYAFGANAGLLTSALGVLVVLLVLPGGLASLVFRVRDRVVSLLTGERVSQLAEPARPERPRLPARPRDLLAANGAPILAARDIVVRYYGHAAVDGVSIHVGHGEILGLLGPNGAGKTTLFDVLSGHQRPTSGRVELHGEDITGLRPEHRARLGMGRTFQQARLFDGLTVLESVQVAMERVEPSEVVPSLLALPPSWRAERRKRDHARDVVDLLGLGPYQSRRISELSTGMRRLAELACVVALRPQVILLDEPTAGIAQAEVERFTPVIGEIRDHLGATLVIVEHDIPLLMSLVDRLYAMAAGRVVAEGPPVRVRSDPAVIAAYLGSDHRFVARSGRHPAPTRLRGVR